MTERSEHPEDLDLRLVQYFTVIAEHRHFGRAAGALHVAQPSLSRQHRRLEQDLGARLFDRNPQGTDLTEAGEVFLPRARALLRSAAQAAAAAHAVATPSHITIGHTKRDRRRPSRARAAPPTPDAVAGTLHLPWDESRSALLGHQADAVVCRLPLETSGLHAVILYDEPRVLLVPRDHRLAGMESVTLDDIAGESMPRLADPMWNEVIAASQAVATVSVGLHAAGMRPGLTAIPLDGVEPGYVVLATRADDRSRLVAAFAKYAQNTLTGLTPESRSPGFQGRTRITKDTHDIGLPSPDHDDRPDLPGGEAGFAGGAGR
jgi:Bacterial regulatory helix-turn-helix protein, lysR family/LysR substrate binding domain